MAECCGKTDDGELPLLTMAQVAAHLLSAVAEWQRAGRPLLSGDAYVERVARCKTCVKGQYAHFQCRQCRCVVYTKAKLATEDCPYGLWPKTVVRA